MESLFRCPLCEKPLRREEGAYRCPSGHSFDIAREGYTHLLPANRKHSAAPGDDREMAAALADMERRLGEMTRSRVPELEENVARMVTYRPLPGQAARTVTVTMKILSRPGGGH